MPIRHRLLAALVAVLWGVNFLAIHASLEQFPPFFLVALRWTLIALPTILFIPRPQVPLRHLVGYGMGFGVLQFAFLYPAMDAGMPTGLASLVLQSSAPFTVLLGLLIGERLTPARALGVGIAVAGLAIVGSQRAGGATWWPFVLTLCAGFGWALGNMSNKLARPPKPLHFSLWMAVVPPVPMFALSAVTEGPRQIVDAVATSGHAWGAWTGLLYTCVLGSVVGSGIWTWLMARHPAGTVAPYSMLVPVVGLSTAWLVLGERPSAIEMLGCAVVVTGVLLTSRTPGRRTRTGVTSAERSEPAGVRAPGPTTSDPAAASSGERTRKPPSGPHPMWSARRPSGPLGASGH